MKLIFKFTLLYLVISAVIFAIGINISIMLFIGEVRDEVDYQLREDLQYLSNTIKKGVDYSLLRGDSKHISVVSSNNSQKSHTSFSDTLAYNTSQGQIMELRKLTAIKEINRKYYKFELLNSLVEPKDAFFQSIKSLGILYFLLVIAMGILSYFISLWLLKPFNATLKKIDNFDVRTHSESLMFPKVHTSEFNRLNIFLSKMTGRVVQDYRNLKEYTENASHEIQTPIAIAKGKLELLSNSNTISIEDAELIIAIDNAIHKISSIEKTLSLLSRLENLEFSELEQINITEVLENLLIEFKELTALKSIIITHDLENKVFVLANSDLLKLMLTNLIKNAIQHNFTNGFINVNLTSETLKITNSGEKTTVPSALLFNRFKKSNQSSNSLGLGLSIVKKICDLHHFNITYTIEEEKHSIIVNF